MGEKKLTNDIIGSQGKALTDAEFRKFAATIFKLTGIVINEGKRALLTNRLEKRMGALGCGSYGDYYALLEREAFKGPESQKFIDSITTNETYFFRAPRIWEYFVRDFLEPWYKANGDRRPMQMWCAASSSGEEPYTIGILCEEFARHHPGFRWAMKASDISSQMIEKCKEGVYSGRSIEKVEPKILERYFDAKPAGGYSVKAQVRKNIAFSLHNLLDSPKGGAEYDIILLRNVMIYFDAPTKEKVLRHMHAALKPKGLLIVGESEGLIGVKAPFEFIAPSIFVRQE